MNVEDILNHTTQFLVVCCCLKILQMGVIFTVGLATVYLLLIILMVLGGDNGE